MGSLQRFVLCAALAAGLCAPALAGEQKADLYPLSTCPVSGKALGAEATTKEYDGRQVRFCCEGCPAAFEKDQAASLAKLDAALIEQQEKDYPLTTCLNSGAELGEKAVSFVIGNRLMKTCCNNCKAKLEGEKAAALEKHTAAIVEKQGATYTAKKCPVSGEDLGAEPVNVVVGNTLVKLCCAGCEKGLAKDPAKHAAAASGEEKLSRK